MAKVTNGVKWAKIYDCDWQVRTEATEATITRVNEGYGMGTWYHWTVRSAPTDGTQKWPKIAEGRGRTLTEAKAEAGPHIR